MPNRYRRLVLSSVVLGLGLAARAQCCTHILQMTDSYGDGWNGGTLQVLVNGSAIGTFAAVGSGSTETFSVCTGDALELIYTPQDWENENSYVLFDQWGNVVFADGPTPGTGSVFTGTGDCTVVPPPGSVRDRVSLVRFPSAS